MIAPAARILRMVYASSGGWLLARASEPAVVFMSKVSKLSLARTGTQCMGPLKVWLLKNAASSLSASASALALTVMRAM
ncbi:Uncharacterised protein [Mycobacteroides abscessus subsp. abscessus]|nr:Uncharacterised protein [Mycobacteroides abscessus subsp. abscessus]